MRQTTGTRKSPGESLHQQSSDRGEMRIGFSDLRFLCLANDQSADIGMIGELVEIAGNAGLPKQRQCLSSGLLVLYRNLGAFLAPFGFFRKDASTDVRVECHTVRQLLKLRTFLRRNAQRDGRESGLRFSYICRGIQKVRGDRSIACISCAAHGDGSGSFDVSAT